MQGGAIDAGGGASGAAGGGPRAPRRSGGRTYRERTVATDGGAAGGAPATRQERARGLSIAASPPPRSNLEDSMGSQGTVESAGSSMKKKRSKRKTSTSKRGATGKLSPGVSPGSRAALQPLTQASTPDSGGLGDSGGTGAFGNQSSPPLDAIPTQPRQPSRGSGSGGGGAADEQSNNNNKTMPVMGRPKLGGIAPGRAKTVDAADANDDDGATAGADGNEEEDCVEAAAGDEADDPMNQTGGLAHPSRQQPHEGAENDTVVREEFATAPSNQAEGDGVSGPAALATEAFAAARDAHAKAQTAAAGGNPAEEDDEDALLFSDDDDSNNRYHLPHGARATAPGPGHADSMERQARMRLEYSTLFVDPPSPRSIARASPLLKAVLRGDLNATRRTLQSSIQGLQQVLQLMHLHDKSSASLLHAALFTERPQDRLPLVRLLSGFWRSLFFDKLLKQHWKALLRTRTAFFEDRLYRLQLEHDGHQEQAMWDALQDDLAEFDEWIVGEYTLLYRGAEFVCERLWREALLVRDSEGRTVLHYAAAMDDVDVLRELWHSRGKADLERRDITLPLGPDQPPIFHATVEYLDADAVRERTEQAKEAKDREARPAWGAGPGHTIAPQRRRASRPQQRRKRHLRSVMQAVTAFQTSANTAAAAGTASETKGELTDADESGSPAAVAENKEECASASLPAWNAGPGIAARVRAAAKKQALANRKARRSQGMDSATLAAIAQQRQLQEQQERELDSEDEEHDAVLRASLRECVHSRMQTIKSGKTGSGRRACSTGAPGGPDEAVRVPLFQDTATYDFRSGSVVDRYGTVAERKRAPGLAVASFLHEDAADRQVAQKSVSGTSKAAPNFAVLLPWLWRTLRAVAQQRLDWIQKDLVMPDGRRFRDVVHHKHHKRRSRRGEKAEPKRNQRSHRAGGGAGSKGSGGGSKPGPHSPSPPLGRRGTAGRRARTHRGADAKNSAEGKQSSNASDSELVSDLETASDLDSSDLETASGSGSGSGSGSAAESGESGTEGAGYTSDAAREATRTLRGKLARIAAGDRASFALLLAFAARDEKNGGDLPIEELRLAMRDLDVPITRDLLLELAARFPGHTTVVLPRTAAVRDPPPHPDSAVAAAAAAAATAGQKHRQRETDRLKEPIVAGEGNEHLAGLTVSYEALVSAAFLPTVLEFGRTNEHATEGGNGEVEDDEEAGVDGQEEDAVAVAGGTSSAIAKTQPGKVQLQSDAQLCSVLFAANQSEEERSSISQTLAEIAQRESQTPVTLGELAAWRRTCVLDAPDALGRTPLHMASALDSEACVRFLIQQGADRARVTHTGRTALSFAQSARIKSMLCDTVVQLLQDSAESGVATASARTASDTVVAKGPLHLLSSTEDVLALSHVMSTLRSTRRAGPRAGTGGQLSTASLQSALHLVCQKGLVEPARALLSTTGTDEHASLTVDERDINGWTALHCCAASCPDNGVDVAEMLLDHGANIDAMSSKGQTPLHVMCSAVLSGTGGDAADLRRRRLLMRWLCIAGANVNKTDRHGLSPLHIAAQCRDAACGQALTKTLLEYGANPYLATHRGRTALHVACENDALHNISLLARWDADYGALAFVKDNHARNAGQTCGTAQSRAALHNLFTACFAGDYNRVRRVLLDDVRHTRHISSGRNASAFSADEEEEDAGAAGAAMEGLGTSAELQHTDDAVVGINDTTRVGGLTALHLTLVGCSAARRKPLYRASEVRMAKVYNCEKAIEAPSSADTRHLHSRSVMHHRSQQTATLGSGNHVDVVALLLAHHVYVDAPDAHGRTALHYAAAGHLNDLVTTLLNAGANPAARDEADNSPLHYAYAFRNMTGARLLEAKSKSSARLTNAAGHRPSNVLGSHTNLARYGIPPLVPAAVLRTTSSFVVSADDETSYAVSKAASGEDGGGEQKEEDHQLQESDLESDVGGGSVGTNEEAKQDF